jgi:hypothetical protein
MNQVDSQAGAGANERREAKIESPSARTKSGTLNHASDA